MKLAILSLLSCLCLFAQQASLEGITMDAGAQTPLAGVHVSLISMGVGTNLPEPDDAYGAISDTAGHYSIGNIRPGTYILKPTHAGFVYIRESDISATPAITLKPGEQKSGYRIVMTPEITITGRVVDEFGDPVQGVDVRAVSASEIQPYGLWAMHDDTDDRGEYRIVGMPGKYYVEASVHPLETSGAPEIRTDGSLTTAYAATYYPGALAKERAKIVEAAAAQELAGIDIHVAHRKSLKISGTVTGIHEGDTGTARAETGAARATVTIRLSANGAEAADTTVAASDGSFAFGGLAPSEYSLEATYPSAVSGESLRSPIVKATVETDDATVTLSLTAGEKMPGTLQTENNAPHGGDREHLTVRLAPVDPHGATTNGGEVADNGSFVIDRIIPGIFQPVVDPLPENAYIKSLSVGGVEMQGGELDLSNRVNGATMKIVVSRNGGQVTGVITNKEGQPLTGRHLFVVLAADPASFATWRNVEASDSAFVIHGIRPGKYRLFAVDPMLFGGLQSYEPLKAIAARAQEIEIKEGDRLTKDLRADGKDNAGAK